MRLRLGRLDRATMAIRLPRRRPCAPEMPAPRAASFRRRCRRLPTFPRSASSRRRSSSRHRAFRPSMSSGLSRGTMPCARSETLASAACPIRSRRARPRAASASNPQTCRCRSERPAHWRIRRCTRPLPTRACRRRLAHADARRCAVCRQRRGRANRATCTASCHTLAHGLCCRPAQVGTSYRTSRFRCHEYRPCRADRRLRGSRAQEASRRPALERATSAE